MKRSLSGSSNPNWKGGEAGLVCIECGVTFYVRPCRRDKAKTCSLPCWNAIQSRGRESRLAAIPKSAHNPHSPRSEETKAKIRESHLRRHPSIAERLMARSVTVESGCREWMGKLCRDLYGTIEFEGKCWGAHRLAWTLKHGPIPDGLLVCHHCDNRKCINTDHHFLGTQSDNMKDMVSKGRWKTGDRSETRKVSEEQVIVIRARLAEIGRGGGRRVAEELGVSQALISQIRSGSRRFANLGEIT